MPYKEDQRKAIAAQMARDGKSPKEISRFFHEHGHGGPRGKGRKLSEAVTQRSSKPQGQVHLGPATSVVSRRKKKK